MPRVRPLTVVQRQLQQNKAADQVLRDRLLLYKDHAKMSDEKLAAILGWERSRVCHIKKAAGNCKLSDIRTLAHHIGTTPEEWLAIGGFQERGKTP